MPQRWFLQDGARVIAELRVDGWHRRATLQAEGRSYTLTSRGFWTTTLVVDDQDGVQVGHAVGIGRRTIDLHGFGAGARAWRSTSLWASRYELLDPGGHPLATFRGRARHAEAEAAHTLPEAPLLFGIMLLSHLRMQAASATVVATP